MILFWIFLIFDFYLDFFGLNFGFLPKNPVPAVVGVAEIALGD